MATLADDLRAWFDQGRHRIRALAIAPEFESIGRVAQIGDGVATVLGLRATRLDELLVFEGGVHGLAVDLGEETIGCVLFDEVGKLSAGSVVRGTGEVARAPVGDALLGRVIDALGAPLDGGEPPAAAAFSKPLSSVAHADTPQEAGDSVRTGIGKPSSTPRASPRCRERRLFGLTGVRSRACCHASSASAQT